MPDREECLVSAAPLLVRVERGAGTGEVRVVVERFDPIGLAPDQRLLLRPECRMLYYRTRPGVPFVHL